MALNVISFLVIIVSYHCCEAFCCDATVQMKNVKPIFYFNISGFNSKLHQKTNTWN